jgi:hypothetical protein
MGTGQGGNQASSKRPMRTIKSAARSQDNAALAGRDLFSQLWGGDVTDDNEYGLSYEAVPESDTHPDKDGNGGWKSAASDGGITRSRKVTGSSDPTPGGGFED